MDPRYSPWRLERLIYGAIALAISMLGIAGFFLLLDSPFVAMFQITVYVGAVSCAGYIRSYVGEDTRTLCSQRG